MPSSLLLFDRAATAVRKGARVTDVPRSQQKEPSADFGRLIVAIAEERSREAFAALFEYFAPRLKTYLRRGGLPTTVAEELAQEAMLAVWRKAASFDPARGGAAAWIFTIARNLKIDHQRRQRFDDPAEPDPSDGPDAPPISDALMIAAERERQVRDAMATLSTEQITIVRLSYFQEKSHSEIAEELKIPLGTVKSRVRLALTRLRALLNDD